MAEEIELDYEYLAQRALKRVVHDALKVTAELGKVPGKHHFYIEFETGAAGVAIPADLRAAYPERMTIVLQHQFDDLAVGEDGFSVVLRFKGRPSRLVVPYSAMTAFSDPGASFGLRFSADETATDDAPPTDRAPPRDEAQASGGAAPAHGQGEGAQVLSLDKFRKK